MRKIRAVAVFCCVLAVVSILGATSGVAVGATSRPAAMAPAVFTAAPAHWYMTPRAVNGCFLNIRSGPSKSFPILKRFTSCTSKAWCWYQQSFCGQSLPVEVIGGRYQCRDDLGVRVWDDRWTVVALTSTTKAYVASWCAWAVHR